MVGIVFGIFGAIILINMVLAVLSGLANTMIGKSEPALDWPTIAESHKRYMAEHPEQPEQRYAQRMGDPEAW